MNIFFLDETPEFSAEYLCDKHIPKMFLESAQMLSTAIQRHTGELDYLYKSAYPKHPMTIWVGDSGGNFNWSMRLLDQLLYQYTMRYNKVHKTIRIYESLLGKHTRWQCWKTEFTPPPQCMPDEYKHKDYITAYKQYYIGEKKRFAKYTGVDTPDFMC